MSFVVLAHSLALRTEDAFGVELRHQEIKASGVVGELFKELEQPQSRLHAVVDYTQAYVDGQVHTNGLENSWSLLKRGLRGTYVSVEPYHLFRYLEERLYRFNSHRDDDARPFAGVLKNTAGRRLTWKQVTERTSV